MQGHNAKNTQASETQDNEVHHQDEPLQLFAKQERIYPRRVSGRFRNIKWAAMIICLAIYYLVPFIRFDRGPNAPNQAVLIDLEHGRAYWFWIEIWPQEVYILTGILILAAIGLFFITSLFGRVWCGYLCFQTVWTDLFVWVERIIQGDRNKRKRLREGPWTFEKIRKLAITHLLWLVIAWWTAGSFVLYFNDAPTLVMSFFTFEVSSTVLGFIGGLTFMTYLMAGFAREQVCTFMCPYARFQSGMFDQDTLIIGYDVARGEPRGKHKKGADWSGLGDCIDCTACVQVCPMGIDIRDGLQMECIACGLCIDACDEVMDKVGLERGLIRYDSENNLEHPDAKAAPPLKVQGCAGGGCGNSSGCSNMGCGNKTPSVTAAASQKTTLKMRLIRPRTIYYALVLCVVGGVMLYALATRSLIDLSVSHERNPLFVTLSSGDIRNTYSIRVLNKTHDDRSYSLSASGIEGAQIFLKGHGNEPVDALSVPAGQVGRFDIFVTVPKAFLPSQARTPIMLTLQDQSTERHSGSVSYETMFIARHR